MSDIIEKVMENQHQLIRLLSGVISDIEDNDGFVSPPIYKKIKEHFNEDIPKNMQDQIDNWKDLYNE